MDEDIPEYPTRRLRLQPCQICGRQFNADILSKHQSICRKVGTKKRRVFDAGKQRATDSDVPYKATKTTAMIYSGQARPQDERGKSKANWREKHNQLIRSIREARSVTRAMKEGGPLPVFRPSEVPSDYVTCPFCRRNFNEHAAKRHMPFCQSQREKKQPPGSKNNQPLNRGRTLPPQSSQYRQQQYPSSGSGGYGSAGGHDVYNNGYKHSNSAPMIVRRHPSELQQPPPPPSQPLPPPQLTKNGDGGWSIRKFFGFGSKEGAPPPQQQQQQRYPMDDEDDYEPQGRYPPPQPQPKMMMRTGRTQENTNLNVRARHRSDDVGPYRTRVPPPAPSSSYGQTRSQYGNGNGNGMGNGQYNNKPMRPTAVGRPPPGGTVRCGDCGNMFTNSSARFCPHCGYRR